MRILIWCGLVAATCGFLLACAGCGGGGGGDSPRCGDGVCSSEESNATCCDDCGCPDGLTCSAGRCVATCGDGVCSTGETSASCCQDCGCAAGQSCQAGSCKSTCGNGTCDSGEDASNCCTDCGCGAAEACQSNRCVSTCGNGTCDANEDADSCCTDCGCANGSTCRANSCVYVGFSSMTWSFTDSCYDGDSVRLRLYDEDDWLVWPAPVGNYYTLAAGASGNATISCTTGNLVCYGADQPAHSIYWGVALDDSETCTDCCFTCAAGTVTRTLVCN